MKGVLNKNGYIMQKKDLTVDQMLKIEEDLIVQPFILNDYSFKKEPIYVPVYQETDTELCLPKYYGLEKFGKPIDKLNHNNYPKIDIEFYIELRHYQEEIMSQLLQGMKKHRGGILTMGCGRGKTNMAIYLINHFKLKTLIVTHAGFLQNQIIDRIRKCTNIDKIGGIGYLQGKTIDVDHPIVVATVQSLSMKEYDPVLFKDFGFVVIDETHHMGGKTFHQAFYKINAPYMLGLTATPRRNDGMFKVINWYMGPQLYYEEQPNNSNVICNMIYYSVSKENENFKTYILRGTDKANRSKMITNLTQIKSRNTLCIKIIDQLLREGRKVLILGGRIDHLKVLEIRLNEFNNSAFTTGLYIGEMKKKELIESEKANAIFGSYQMAQEGLDIGDLDSLVLVTPISDIQQSIGRILRKTDYKHTPTVYDICDQLPVFISQSNKRRKYYLSKEYKVCGSDFKAGTNLEPVLHIKPTKPLLSNVFID